MKTAYLLIASTILILTLKFIDSNPHNKIEQKKNVNLIFSQIYKQNIQKQRLKIKNLAENKLNPL